MITYSGILFLALSFGVVLLTNVHFHAAKSEVTLCQHRFICIAAIIAGCVMRFCALGSLPYGLNAEEALTAVQAKALWQTGGFLFDGRLTAQFDQWTGEAGGPFLSLLTAPFVGVMGMSMMAVRLPLTLLSCAAMFAAYGVGKEISGTKAARWMLVIYAICPAFILNARFAAPANAAVFLMPIVFYVLIRGFAKAAWLYAGMLLAGLMAYTYNIYMFIVPFVIPAAAFFAWMSGAPKRHCVLSAAFGLLLCVPAMMTLWVNLSGAEGFVLLDMISIPRLEGFEKADFVWTGCENLAQLVAAIRDKTYVVVFGSLFQMMRHENIADALFAPSGIQTFYTMNVPIAFLGILAFLNGSVANKNRKGKTDVKRAFLAVSCIVVMLMLVLVGNKGMLDYSGGTSVFDYSALHMFLALLITVGLCRIERKSVFGQWSVMGLFAASALALCVFLFGGAYENGANTHFVGLDEAYEKAAKLQEETGYDVCLTTTVYPHMDPANAAEMMYLYASDGDIDSAIQRRGDVYRAVYLEGVEYLEPDTIYVAQSGDLINCELEGWKYEEFGEYVLLSLEN